MAVSVQSLPRPCWQKFRQRLSPVRGVGTAYRVAVRESDGSQVLGGAVGVGELAPDKELVVEFLRPVYLQVQDRQRKGVQVTEDLLKLPWPQRLPEKG